MVKRLVLITVAVGLLAGCGSAPAPSPTATVPTPGVALSSRPSSPAKIWFISPPSAQNTVKPGILHIDVGISGAMLTTSTSTHISPTLGHIHLYANGALTYMNYKPTLDFPVQAGFSYAIRAEFVASDHYPFNPRVYTPTIFVTVTR